jgi:hypothetical protein
VKLDVGSNKKSRLISYLSSFFTRELSSEKNRRMAPVYNRMFDVKTKELF